MATELTKSRHFTFLLYPESLSADWEIKLEGLGVPIAISPLHDKDKTKSKDKSRVYKKAHYHAIYVANNPVTADSVRKKLQRALGNQAVKKVQIVDNIENMYLYLTHESKDAVAKKKHKYDRQDIKHLNLFDIDRYISLSVEDKEFILDKIIDLIRYFKIPNVLDLEDYIINNGDDYGLQIKDVRTVMKSYNSMLRSYFDAAYQIVKREEKQDN
jgi:hypothetical protein